MALTSEISGIGRGWTVYSADGAKIGDVDEAYPAYLKLRQGLIFKHDLFVPVAAVSELRGTDVHLNVRESDVSLLGWETLPETAARPWVTLQRIPVDEQRRALADRVFVSNPLRVPIFAEAARAHTTPVVSAEVVITKERGAQQVEVDVANRGAVVAGERDEPLRDAVAVAAAERAAPGAW